MQEAAAPTRGDFLQSVIGCMPPVVMKIAGQKNRYLLIAEDLIFEKRQIVFRIVLIILSVNFRVNPMWFCGAQNDSITVLHFAGNAPEIPHLWNVDIRIELNVRTNQPPIVRQPERKVAAALPRLPTGEPTARTE